MNGCMPMQPQPYDYGYAYPNPMHHKNLVDVIHNCQAVCEHMTSILKKRSDVQMRVMQLELLRDCADICGLTANYVARDSMYAKSAAELCACICESCARECSRFPDAESQHCAQVCMHCARECRAFAMMR
ncbi:four-helix bundle copper-binding protein [Petroclostridium sp. X23]|uniref:four-helix bundle copper-binding protein n=1 Tax=Petroclostridium sp. X23 TaxID=3045146 RepID=UPI0024AE17CF|nr:four-helix bundle copper-binding protein [Petroclostridium sp. X23]WHH58438.1 four-helix bundle copper-binding protein [Petroclostridium sp. X23]